MIRATALALLIGLAGCGGRAAFTRVEFRAPSQPDPVLRPFLADVDHIGVVCATNIEPFRELDIEKVMARLSNAVVRSLGNMPKTEVMNQDEITYKLKDIRLDSTSVHQDSVRAILKEGTRTRRLSLRRTETPTGADDAHVAHTLRHVAQLRHRPDDRSQG